MIGADSLGYLSTDGLAKALGVSARHFCWACLTGKYPIPVPRELREATPADTACQSLEDREEREPVTVLADAEWGEALV